MKKRGSLILIVIWVVLFLLAECSPVEQSLNHRVVVAATATQRSDAYHSPLGYPYPPPVNTPASVPSRNPYPWPMKPPSATPTASPTMTPKLSITPLTGTGLTWYECEVPKQLYPGWQTCEPLLGFSRNYVEWGDNSPFGEHFEVEGELAPRIRLTIGEDAYELRHHPHDGRGYSDNQGMAYYTIDKNSQLLYSIFTPYAWRQSLLNISGKYTLHLGSPGSDVIIYDGIDLRKAYNLDGAAIPWVLNDQLIFIGYKNERYFVIYDGKQIGPKFSHILIAYCCETALYSVQRPLGQYWFNGERDGRYYVVAITVDQ